MSNLESSTIPAHEVGARKFEGAAAIIHASRGLETFSNEQLASYLISHPRLFVGVSYLPNAITVEMIQEAMSMKDDPTVKAILIKLYGDVA